MARNATATVSAADARPIEPGVAYPLAALRERGLGTAAIREMRRAGMPVRRCGRMTWVLGEDIIDHLRTKAEVIA